MASGQNQNQTARPKLLEVFDLRAYFDTRRGLLRAVDGISFSVAPGQILGLAGESGCGKTTVGLSLMRLLPPGGRIAGGVIRYRGQDVLRMPLRQVRRIRWKEIAMIFQGAMNALNPVRSVREQTADAIVLHDGVPPAQAYRRVAELFELVGIPQGRASEYPHEFSGGMRQRVMIAMALACGPKVVIADEPTTALDVMVQAQILELLRDLQGRLGLSLVVISHDLAFLAELCDHILVMYAGKLVESGPVDALFRAPKHPYTQCLVSAIPRIRGPRVALRPIPGDPPDLTQPLRGCYFRDRCPAAIAECGEAEPQPRPVMAGHLAACHLYPREGP